ncbi:hypothetical protein AND_003400 [Anopheles darlingi]|uniref:Uncharacterized protein n=1 Tax=Anopheles darlingi TaxID=43151 RepID=W5JKE5_ANODA|nr:hypothetical protein AND_003400 [Anopheles darlingi]
MHPSTGPPSNAVPAVERQALNLRLWRAGLEPEATSPIGLDKWRHQAEAKLFRSNTKCAPFGCATRRS